MSQQTKIDQFFKVIGSQYNGPNKSIDNMCNKKTSTNNTNKKKNISNNLVDVINERNSNEEKRLIFTKKLNSTNFICSEIINKNLQLAIINLNLLKQGNIIPNQFDLQEVYRNKTFNIRYNITDSNTHTFQLKNITFFQEKQANHLIMIVIEIFSKSINCGYFIKSEVDIIFALFNLFPESQMLFIKLLKRKVIWHRINILKYSDITNNLEPLIIDLVQNGFCQTDLKLVDLLTLLNMLKLKEVKSICKTLKINHHGSKKILIDKLFKYGNFTKSFYEGARSPYTILRSLVLSFLQTCVYLPKKIINLFDRLFTLFYPIQDPSENISDLFFLLYNVQNGVLLYPPSITHDSFPIFKNRTHLIHFIKSKNVLRNIIISIKKKEWHEVKKLGHLAYKDENYLLPSHVKMFMPEFMWIKVLSKSIDAFKKTSETRFDATVMLKTLIDTKNFSHNNYGEWYNELALIKMHYEKDFEGCAQLILRALEEDTLTSVDVSNLIAKLKQMIKKRTGISNETNVLIKNKIMNTIATSELIPVKIISANLINRIKQNGKSLWSLSVNCNEKYYGNVEMLALQYYISQEHFQEGLHCEGSLPTTLFTICFWEEIYNDFIPGSFVSPYQNAPLDLFTSEFFNNRKESIEKKFKFINELKLDFCAMWIQERYSNFTQYKSLLPTTLFHSAQQLKELVICLGIIKITNICKKLISNFKLWRSGFPDLILWNVSTLKCKIVEVKGPRDTLSEKQKLWLQYLSFIGIETEICYVKVSRRNSK